MWGVRAPLEDWHCVTHVELGCQRHVINEAECRQFAAGGAGTQMPRKVSNQVLETSDGDLCFRRPSIACEVAEDGPGPNQILEREAQCAVGPVLARRDDCHRAAQLLGGDRHSVSVPQTACQNNAVVVRGKQRQGRAVG